MYRCRGSMPGYCGATSLNTRCHRAWPCVIALLLSAMQTLRRPFAAANSNACFTIRCTPL